MGCEVDAGRAVRGELAGRADVVGGDRVAELGQDPRAVDVGHRAGLALHAVEVWRLAHVRRLRRPFEGVALRGRKGAPAVVAGEDVGVVAGEHLLGDRGVDHLCDVGRVRPDVGQEDVDTLWVGAEWLRLRVPVHGAGPVSYT